MSSRGLGTKQLLRVAGAVKEHIRAEIRLISNDEEFRQELYEDYAALETICAEITALGMIDCETSMWLKAKGKEWGVI